MLKTRNRKTTLELLSIPKFQTEKLLPPKAKQVPEQFENYGTIPTRGTLNIKQGIYSNNKVIRTVDLLNSKTRELTTVDIQRNSKNFIKKESETNLKPEEMDEGQKVLQLQKRRKHKYSIHKRRSDEVKQINIKRQNNEPSSYMAEKNNELRDIDFEGEIESYFEVLKNSISDIIEEKVKLTLNPFMESVASRFEDLSVELKNQDNNAMKIFKELNSKICQYGEHHSRHLHYLCMRTEYEKLAQISFINNNKEVLNDSSISKPENPAIKKCSCSDIKQNIMNGNEQLSQSTSNDEKKSEINIEQSLNNNELMENQMSISYLLGELKKRNLTAAVDGNLEAPPSTPFIQNTNPVNPVNQVNISSKSSELGLKEILATIQQYYPPTPDGHSGDDLSRTYSKLHMGNGDYNNSDEDDEFSDENTP